MMGRKRTIPTPSLPTRLQNWAGITPKRIREVDDFAREAFLPPDDLKYPDEPDQPSFWYASSMIPPSEIWER